MKLRLDDLSADLSKGLRPVYLIGGDEPLLVQEAAAQVREATRAAGVDDRQVFHVDAQFDWAALAAAAGSLSLFSTRRLLDLRLPTGKPGRDGGKWLKEFAQDPGDDILLVTTDVLKRDQLASAWGKALDRAGVLVRCFSVGPDELPRWLNQRMIARGLQPEREAVRLLAERVEGNLLAAAQAVDRLLILRGSGPVSVDEVTDLVADSSRFDVFKMMEAMVAGQPDRVLRMARSLRGEGVAPQLVSWALAREIRLLCQLRRLHNEGGNGDALLNRNGIWESRKIGLQRAMRRRGLASWEGALAACARLDRMVKGREEGDPWMSIEQLAVKVARGGAR